MHGCCVKDGNGEYAPDSFHHPNNSFYLHWRYGNTDRKRGNFLLVE